MIAIISPSKSQDFSFQECPVPATQPQFLSISTQLVPVLKKYSVQELRDLMDISEELAVLNKNRFEAFSLPFTNENAKPALLAFKGDVYTGFSLDSYTKEDFEFAQAHLRILSGLYGVLKPLDLIQPYRLEMGIPVKTKKAKNLYEFWGKAPTSALTKPLSEDSSKELVNLASAEYFKVLDFKAVKASRVITPVFKEKKGDSYKVIGLFAKKARGLMCNYMIKNKLENAEELKTFAEEGYSFREQLSTKDEWVFARG